MVEKGTCQNCGRELMMGQGSPDACVECCGHPEIKGRESALMVPRCEVCGAKVDEEGNTHPDEFGGSSEGN